MQLPTKWRSHLQKRLNKRRWQAAFLTPLLVFMSAWLIAGEVISRAMSLQLSILYSLLYLALFVTTTELRASNIEERSEDIKTDISELKSKQSAANNVTALKTEEAVKDHFSRNIEPQNVETALMIEYSSDAVSGLRDDFIDGGTELFLLVKRPDMAVGHERRPMETNSYDDFRALQPRKIFKQVFGTDGIRENRVPDDFDNLHIRFYELNASVRGRKIGDEHLYLGWYTYDEAENPNKTPIWGDVNPMIHVPSDHPEFEHLDNFFVARSAKDLWDSGSSAKELYSEGVPWIRNWVEEKNTDERLQFIEQISDTGNAGDVSFETAFDITAESRQNVRQYR